MVLIAVTGPPGSGKTELLCRLAEWARGQQKSVDGFFALPVDRRDGKRGADRYDLLFAASGRRMPFAMRNEAAQPPYDFDAGAQQAVGEWAASLARSPRADLLVLDEFGTLEASGGGHARHFPAIAATDPAVVVMAVREALIPAMERQLGAHFDLTFDAARAGTLRELQELLLQHADWVRAGVFGTAAGGFEASVGTLLHAGQIPFRGQMLSTAQALVMMYAGEDMRIRSRVVWVPYISAGLKALSPAGSRLRPMLAISAQGSLFGAAVALLGWNVAGISVAGGLVGAWAAAQGMLLQYLFVGADLFQAYDTALRWVGAGLHLDAPAMATILPFWIASWGGITAAVTGVAWMHRHRFRARFARLIRPRGIRPTVGAQRPTVLAALRHGFRDLFRPHFWIPLLIIAALLLVSGSSWEALAWTAFRATSVAWALFALARMIDPQRISAWLRKAGHWGPALAFNRAMRQDPEQRSDRES